ncbi:hypothetical protein [Burkholderia multivorans]|uniref:hypothetical protein n=1 Tax=Burkholderia multivorans TaxID=87883 RepID=UPI000CFFAB6A|nr:hypothetical protein [Burkholderia multivorans]PRG41466.1 hypothetical protein C6T68_05535 [Burkholderia multivorans]
MKQEVFDGIARGKLPLLAASLSDQQVPMDGAHSSGPLGAPGPVNVDLVSAHIQWTAILAQISHTAERCAHSDMVQQLKAFGVKRTRTVVIDLAHEYVKARGMATSLGFAPKTREVVRIARAMPVHEQLADEFRALANAYRKLSTVLVPKDQDRFSRWIVDHATVHDSRARNLAREAAEPMCQEGRS